MPPCPIATVPPTLWLRSERGVSQQDGPHFVANRMWLIASSHKTMIKCCYERCRAGLWLSLWNEFLMDESCRFRQSIGNLFVSHVHNFQVPDFQNLIRRWYARSERDLS